MRCFQGARRNDHVIVTRLLSLDEGPIIEQGVKLIADSSAVASAEYLSYSECWKATLDHTSLADVGRFVFAERQ